MRHHGDALPLVALPQRSDRCVGPLLHVKKALPAGDLHLAGRLKKFLDFRRPAGVDLLVLQAFPLAEANFAKLRHRRHLQRMLFRHFFRGKESPFQIAAVNRREWFPFQSPRHFFRLSDSFFGKFDVTVTLVFEIFVP